LGSLLDRFHSKNARMVQHLQVNKHSTTLNIVKQ
jgi:hypothetical protein